MVWSKGLHQIIRSACTTQTWGRGPLSEAVLTPRSGSSGVRVIPFGGNLTSREFSSSVNNEIQDLITSTIDSNKVTIFSKTYCPFCTKTKGLFQSLEEDAMILELDVRPDGAAIQAELAKMTGQRSVPNVFVNGQHVGGNDDTHAAHQSGKLKQLLLLKR